MLTLKSTFFTLLALVSMAFLAGCSSSSDKSVVALEELSIKAAVYDDKETVAVDDDSLSIYFNQPIDIEATKDAVSKNFDIIGTGSLGDLVSVEYDSSFHKLKITLDANSIKFISGETKISFTSANSWEGLFTVDKIPVVITSPQVVVTVTASRTYTDVNGTVIDDATGIVWEQEDDDIKRDWNDAKAYCESLAKDGLEWRLPTIDELIALSDKTVSSPAIDGEFFSNTNNNEYWSGSEYLASSNPDDIWTVNFTNSNTNNPDKNATLYVRCVFAEESASSSLYTRDDVNEVVLDTSTNLMWEDTAQSIGDENKKTWNEAITQCKNLELAAYDDWRLPDINELDSITDKSTSAPAMSEEFQNSSSSIFWSSTDREHNTSEAWYTYFWCGCNDFRDKASVAQVRCVRSAD